MKKTLQTSLSLLLALLLALSLSACRTKEVPEGLWKNAAYTEDTAFGSGETTITAQVEIQDRTVTFTVHTDQDTVGEALLEHGLIAGEEGPYGLYVKTVNGVLADYDADGHYWSFYVGEEGAMQGVDQTPVEAGAVYRFVYA